MAKIETAIKDAIARGARKQIRQVATPLRREVRRLRQALRQLRADIAGVRDVAAQWRLAAPARPWQPDVSEAEARAARLSPSLIRKLRARLGVSQAGLARLVAVSAGAVVQWEGGRSTPSGANRRRLVALRKLGRRDAKRVLAGLQQRAKKPRKTSRRPRPGRGLRRKR